MGCGPKLAYCMTGTRQGNLENYGACAHSQWAVIPPCSRLQLMKNIDLSPSSRIMHPKLHKGFAPAYHEQHIATEWKQHRVKHKHEMFNEAETLASLLAAWWLTLLIVFDWGWDGLALTFVFLRDGFIENCCSNWLIRTVEWCVKTLLMRCPSLEDISSSTCTPLLRSANRLRGWIAPELMLFLLSPVEQLFRRFCLFQIGESGCTMIAASVFANTNKVRSIIGEMAVSSVANSSSCHRRSCVSLDLSGSNTNRKIAPPQHIDAALIRCDHFSKIGW